MTHSDLWRAIDTIAAENNLTRSGLALRSGLCSTAFNKSKRVFPNGEPRWLSMLTVAKVLSAVNINLVHFAHIVDDMNTADKTPTHPSNKN